MTAENREPEKAFRVVVFADFVCPYSFLAVEARGRARTTMVCPRWREAPDEM